MKRVLLTGGSGFIGRNCISPLTSAGYEIHVAGRTPLPKSVAVTFHETDLLDQGSRRQLLDTVQPTHLLHTAWDLTVADYMNSINNYAWAAASLDLTREFTECGGERCVHIGSCYEYEWSDDALDERTTRLSPWTHYGRAKAGLSRLAADAADAAGLSLAWSRLFFLYGPHEGSERLIPSVIRKLLAGVEAPTSHGMQKRDYIFVEDAGAALVALLDSDVEGPVNIGAGEAVSIAELVSETAEICGRPDLLRLGDLPSRPNEAPLVTAAIKRLESEVGWSDVTPRRQALEMTVEWWRQELSL